MRILPVKEAAQRLGVAKRSLEDKRYRARIGLPVIRIGRRVGFEESAIETVIARGRESVPVRQEVQPESVLCESSELVNITETSHA